MNNIRLELQEIFKEILEIDHTFDQDALFIELGGQSILMGVLQNEIRQRFGVEVPFADLFVYGSVNALEKYIINHRNNVIYGYEDVDFKPEPEKRYESFPMTDLQMAYYIGRQEDTELGGNPTRGYSEIICTSYDHERMEQAINKLIAVHDVLRLHFFGDCTQRVEKEMDWYVLPYEDISDLSDSSRKDFIEKKREQIFNTLFDITELPLIRFESTRISKEEVMLHFSHDGLILDGWSHEKLIHDLDTIYGDIDAEFKRPEILFRDYVRYLELVKASQKYMDDREYWLNRSGENFEKPALPLKCDPTQVKDVNTRQVIRYIDKELWSNVKKYANKKGITPFSLLITAFGKSILKYSSNNNFLINIPASIRPNICDDIGDLLGECSNFFICNFSNSPDVSILDTAYENQKQISDVMQHNFFMGTDYIRELQKRNGANIVAPIVFTSIIDTPVRDSKYLSKIYTKTHTSQVWIDAIAMKNGDGIMLIMDCVAELFEENLTEGIGDTFVKILELYGKESSYIEECGYAPLLENERNVIADCIHAEENKFLPDLSHLLLEAYNKYKENTAIIYNDVVTTYEEMYQEAFCTAKEIKKRTKRVSKFHIGVFMDKSKYQPISAIAATLMNCAYLPLDIQYGIEEINYCIEKADVKILITDNMYYDKLKEKVKCEILNIEKVHFTYSNKIEFIPALPTDSAFIINTSGTTGRSKSVDLKREGLVNCLIETKNKFHLDSEDKFFAITNYCHDMSVYDIYGPFIMGGTMVIPNRDKQKEPSHWVHLIKKYEITFWNSVPSFHEMLVEAGIEHLPDYLDSIKHIISGGETLKVSLAKRIRQNFRNAELYNVGGPSETTIWSIWHKVTDKDFEKDFIPYGKPIKNMRYYILNDMMSICPQGVEGTMFVSGIGVSKGYLGLEDVTKKNFVSINGNRFYNTGDRGLYLPDGTIKFLGRRDRQVKINGKRIELEGIAHQINECMGVMNCEVILAEKDQSLVAFFTGEKKLDTDKILRKLRKELPDYMVPTNMLYVETMPLTQNGKTDIAVLNRLYSDLKTEIIEEEYQSKYEEEVVEICKEILNRENISPKINFYEIGGNSISAIKIMSTIKKKYNVALSIYDILNHPYIREWCKILEKRISFANGIKEDNSIPINEITDCIPLSESQKGIWFQSKSAQMQKSSNIFVLAGSIMVEAEKFDYMCFKSSLNRLIAETPELRTEIYEQNYVPYQKYNEVFEYTPVIHMYDKNCIETAAIMEEEVIRNKINMDVFPLFVVEIGRSNDGKVVVTIGIHHIIADAYSIGLLLSKLEHYYKLELEDKESSISVSNKQHMRYADYAIWQEKMLDEGGFSEDIAYWKEKFSDMPVMSIAEREVTWGSFETEVLDLDITADQMKEFKVLCKKNNTTAFSGMAAVINMVMHYYFETNRIILGMAYSGRGRTEYEDTIGCFAVGTVIDTVIHTSDKYTDILEKTNRSIDEAVRHSSLPFHVFAEKAGADIRYATIPYNILLNCLDTENISQGIFSEFRYAKCDLPAELSITAEFLKKNSHISIVYGRDLFDKDFISELGDVLAIVFKAVSKNASITLGEVMNLL